MNYAISKLTENYTKPFSFKQLILCALKDSLPHLTAVPFDSAFLDERKNWLIPLTQDIKNLAHLEAQVAEIKDNLENFDDYCKEQYYSKYQQFDRQSQIESIKHQLSTQSKEFFKHFPEEKTLYNTVLDIVYTLDKEDCSNSTPAPSYEEFKIIQKQFLEEQLEALNCTILITKGYIKASKRRNTEISRIFKMLDQMEEEGKYV